MQVSKEAISWNFEPAGKKKYMQIGIMADYSLRLVAIAEDTSKSEPIFIRNKKKA